ncbi:MAG: hypothetical protein M1438_15385 [Deltaproteobacteria bacterium]|nr:hypothetical protein [Deltaproteobacteria bacterium]
MPLNWQRKWLPLLIPLALFAAWLVLSLIPHLAGGATLDEFVPPGFDPGEEAEEF